MDDNGKITTHDIDAAEAALRSGRCTFLNAGGARLWGDAGAARIAAVLEAGDAPNLVTLHLGGTEMGDAGAESLAAALEAGGAPKLEHLVLDFNRLTEAGAERLAAALDAGGAPNLDHLGLGGNESHDGAHHMAGSARAESALVQVRNR